jgi:hypothetical protein
VSAALSSGQAAWRTLTEQPLAFVDAQRLAQCWPQPLTDQQHAALYSLPRFQARLAQLLIDRFELQPLASLPLPTDDDLPVLLLSPEDFKRLPRLCGAIWHAATLSREIRSEVVNQLRSGLGHDVFAVALANRSLAGAADLLRPPAELLEAIDRDGASAVSAWLHHQPAALRDWLRVRLDETLFEGPAGAFDLNIVRRAAETFVPPAEEVA